MCLKYALGVKFVNTLVVTSVTWTYMVIRRELFTYIFIFLKIVKIETITFGLFHHLKHGPLSNIKQKRRSSFHLIL